RGQERGWAVWQYEIRPLEMTQEVVYTAASEFRPVEEERLRVVVNRLTGQPISTFHHIDLFSPGSDTVMVEHDLEVKRGEISGRRRVGTRSGGVIIVPVSRPFATGTVLSDYVFLAHAGEISYDAVALPNLLGVISLVDHSPPIVSVDVWYNTGSRDERPGRSGFAHLFEHMMFEGSAHVKKGEHFQLISRAGGSENGSTAEDRTNYYETLPSNRLNLALWLEADRMRSLAITDEHFQNQRETVKEERRLRVDNQPYSPAFIDGMTWPFDSAGCFAYAHTVIGSMGDLDAAQLSDVRAFFDTYYAPNNATLVVVGAFKPLELRRYVNQYFSEIPRHTEPPAVGCSSRLSPGVERREVTDAHANLPAVLRIYRAPPHADPDTRALELLNVILGQGESSRLNVAVVRREKAAFGTQVFMNPFDSRRGPGVLLVLAIANQGVDPLKLDTIVTAQLDSIRAAG